MSDYAIILRSCPAAAAEAVQAAIARLFGIKEATCQNICESAPIVIVGNLDRSSAAAMQVMMRGIEVAGGDIEFGRGTLDDLPRINWPKPPQILKQEITDAIPELSFIIPGHGSLIELLGTMLDQRLGEAGSAAIPIPASEIAPATPAPDQNSREVFEEAELGEITPFSNAALTSTPSTGSPNLTSEDVDLLSRMEEMFPDDDDIIPNTKEVTDILNRLLPDDEGTGVVSRPSPAAQTPSTNGNAGGAFSLFLARIADDNRRKKVVPLLVEMIGIEETEAENLSKKVIIPVLKNVSKDDAEAAKHKFAEIGVLARIKGG